MDNVARLGRFRSVAARVLARLHLRGLVSRLRRRRMPMHVRVRWFGAGDDEQAAQALAQWGRTFLEKPPAGGWLLNLGEGGSLHQALTRRLQKEKLAHRNHALSEILDWTQADAEGLRGILCGYGGAKQLTQSARALARHPALSPVPFEYAAGLDPERAQFRARDQYRDTYFVAPSLLDSPGPYQLYEESLRLFEQKCGLRDFLDLYQVIKFVVGHRVPGDIAEFGSYKGHSGYLIARTLQALGSDKRVYLFDTFERFPGESQGMDHFWSLSHAVDFERVREALSHLPNVRLVKGDFTTTLATSEVRQLALAYVDCDSYRATRYLIDTLWSTYLAPRAALVCEDYGHPALLGNRAAVHEEFDGRADAFKFFSQFSGLYITLKL